EGDTAQLKMRVIVAVDTAAQLPDEHRYLQLVQPVPSALSANAEAVEQGRRDFQQLSLSREGLARIFRITLTLIFLLTVFSAVAASFLLSGWLTGPLSMLAAGTRAVAEGDYRPVKDYTGRDERGALTQAGNRMTRQREDARMQVARIQRELQRVHARLERVLAKLTAAVLLPHEGVQLLRQNIFVAKFAMNRSPIQRTFVPVALERGWNVAFSSNVVKRMTAMYKGRRPKI